MKECNNCEDDFPEFKPGDVLIRAKKDSCYLGEKFLVCRIPELNNEKRLLGLNDGRPWSNDSFFGRNSEGWEKIEVCYKVLR